MILHSLPDTPAADEPCPPLIIRYAFLVLLLFSGLFVEAQQNISLSADDMQRVRDVEVFRPELADRHVHYGFGTSRQQRFNPFYHVLSSCMYLYQRCVSPVLSRSCAYAPSCSGYSKKLVAEYGLVKGVLCSADRLMRCNRITLADPATYSLINPSDGHIHESVHRYRLR